MQRYNAGQPLSRPKNKEAVNVKAYSAQADGFEQEAHLGCVRPEAKGYTARTRSGNVIRQFDWSVESVGTFEYGQDGDR